LTREINATWCYTNLILSLFALNLTKKLCVDAD